MAPKPNEVTTRVDLNRNLRESRRNYSRGSEYSIHSGHSNSPAQNQGRPFLRVQDSNVLHELLRESEIQVQVEEGKDSPFVDNLKIFVDEGRDEPILLRAFYPQTSLQDE